MEIIFNWFLSASTNKQYKNSAFSMVSY